MKMLHVFMFIIFMLINFTGCAQDETSISINELKEKMKNNQDLLILDVRTPPELSGPLGHIDGVINIPIQELDQRIKEIDQYKDKEIAVICRTGRRSNIGAEILKKNNFNAFNVRGGMVEYRRNETN